MLVWKIRESFPGEVTSDLSSEGWIGRNAPALGRTVWRPWGRKKYVAFVKNERRPVSWNRVNKRCKVNLGEEIGAKSCCALHPRVRTLVFILRMMLVLLMGFKLDSCHANKDTKPSRIAFRGLKFNPPVIAWRPVQWWVHLYSRICHRVLANPVTKL